MSHEEARVLVPAGLPAMVERLEVAFVLAGEHGTQTGGSLKMELVRLALNAEVGRHINQVARRSELTGHLFGDEAVVKIQGYQAVPAGSV